MLSRTADAIYWLERYIERAENVVRFLTFDRENPNSILSCLWSARENARTVQDTISSELWEQVNTFYLLVKRASRQSTIVSSHKFFAEIEQASHLCTGIADSTMSHSEAWQFARFAERRWGQLRSDLDYADLAETLDASLHEYLEDFQQKLNQVGVAMFNTFFAFKPLTAGSRILT